MEGAPTEEVDYSSLAIEDCLSHKQWKARVSGYERLAKQFSLSPAEDAACFKPYIHNPDLLKKAVTDSNVAAQEKGLDCVCVFVEFSGKNAIPTRDTVLPGVIDKCMGSTRAAIKTKAIELCELYTEVEGTAASVLTPLIDGLKAKQPKIVASCVAALKELVKEFGIKVVPAQPILKALPAIFAHTDKNVRAEGTLLVQEIYRYIGPTIETFLAPLKPVQVKEINEAFQDMNSKSAGQGTGQQTRFTRDQQREQAIKAAESSLDGQTAPAEEEDASAAEADLDVDGLIEPIPVQIPPDFYEQLASPKWSERKNGALDPLLQNLQAPKFIDADYSELVRALAGRMSDANVICVMLAANCLEALAKGLRNSFDKYKSVTVPPVLEKFKEKKQNVVDALSRCLDAVALSVPISDLTEDIATFAKHKNPSVKSETFKWLVRCLKETRTKPSPADVKALVACLLPATEDSFEPVRAAAQESLGTLMKILGERAMVPYLDSVDDLRKTKIKEYYEKAEVKVKNTPAAAPAARSKPAPSSSKPPPKTPVLAKSERPPSSPAPSTKPASAPPKAPAAKLAPSTKKPAAAATSTPKALPKTATAGEAPKLRYSQEEAEGLFESALPAETIVSLADSNWKNRLAGMDSLLEHAQDNTALDSELVIRCLSKKPGWKESNFQVYGRVFQLFQQLAENNPTWSKGCAVLVIPPATDKLGDIKLKKPAGDLLSCLAEKTCLQFVLSQAYEPLTKQKAPKAQADSLLWLDCALREFGIKGLSVRELIEFLKTALKSTNAAVRTNATKVLVTLKIFVGAGIRDLLQDLNPALLTTIDSEFSKVDGEQPPEPTRISEELQQASAPTSKGARQTANDPVDELFPRVDLEKLLPHSLITACNDANWKVRKEALENIQGILEANKRIKPTIGDLSSVLKLRLADSNKVVQNLALDLIKRVAVGMEKPFERYCKNLLPPIVLVLADQKQTTRSQALSVLTSIADSCGVDSMVAPLASGLENTNPALRKEVLAWLAEREEASKGDLAALVLPLLPCLEDRNSDVRKAAVQILPVVIASVGYSTVFEQTSSLKPASRALVAPLVEAARPSGTPSSASSNKPPSSVAAPLSARPASSVGKPIRRSLAPNHLTQTSRPGTPPVVPPSASGPSSRILRKVPAPGTASRPRPLPLEDEPEPKAAEPPIKTADQRFKLQRAAKEQGPLRWHVDGQARPEQIEFLHQQMMPHFSSSMMELLFSTDHHSDRDYLSALAVLDDCLLSQTSSTSYGVPPSDMKSRWLANLDLLFKYVTIRLSDSATTIVLKCLDFVDHLMLFLSDENYFLSDYESNCCLPALIAKLGDQKEVLRSRVRGLLKSCSTIYPASKIFQTLLDYGVTSKNSRARAESLEELVLLIQRHGSSVYVLSRVMPVIVSVIGDKEAAARSAALQVISALYGLEGEAILAYTKKLSVKDQGLLSERLRRTPSASDPPTPANKPSSSNHTNAKDPEKLATSLTSPVPSRRSDDRITAIANTNDAISVEALKVIQKDISNKPASLLPLVDALVIAIVSQMRLAFSQLLPSTNPSSLRLAKHLMQTLSGLFDEPRLSKAVSQEALVELLAELTRRLLETADSSSNEALGSLSKVLNMVLIRIFHNANKNACFGALLVILEHVTIDLRQLQGTELEMRARYAELVMKCLWKISKTAKDGLQENTLELEKLLHDIDHFLAAIAPAEWRRRASDNVPLGDMPLRTCKTILQQIVTLYGERVFDELDHIQLGDSSFVGAYLRRLVGNSQSTSHSSVPARIKHELQRTESTTSARSVLSETASVTSGGTSPGVAVIDDRELNQQLKEIFDAVGQPERSKQGIVALYEFRQAHPEAEGRIQSWIDATGRHFKSYLERAMSNIDLDRKGRASTGAAPMSPPGQTTRKSTSPNDRSSTSSSSAGKLQDLQSLFGFTSANT